MEYSVASPLFKIILNFSITFSSLLIQYFIIANCLIMYIMLNYYHLRANCQDVAAVIGTICLPFRQPYASNPLRQTYASNR